MRAVAIPITSILRYLSTPFFPVIKLFGLRSLIFNVNQILSQFIYLFLKINGNIYAPKDPSAWRCEDGNCDQWIHFKRVDNLSVYGSGIINGQGEKWWEIKHPKKPSALEISQSNNVRLSDLTFKNNPRMHVVLSHIDTLHVSNITIDAPGDSPNTDGIHISGCTNVLVDNCTIATGKFYFACFG